LDPLIWSVKVLTPQLRDDITYARDNELRFDLYVRPGTVAMMLADLGVTKSHSRPHCPNDNPFSESQFKTLKYRPDFPERFGSQQHARDFCRIFFPWYCDEHRHSGLGYLTPADVHYGRAEITRARRVDVLSLAYAAHPERFVRKPPEPPQLPRPAWINRPVEEVVPTHE
jgi:putative transposase